MSDSSEMDLKLAALNAQIAANRAEIAANKGVCDQRHDKMAELKSLVVENREKMIEAFGRSGKNGRLGELEKDMSNVEATMERVSQTMQAMERRVDRQGIKIGIIVAIAAGVAGLIGPLLVRWIGG